MSLYEEALMDFVATVVLVVLCMWFLRSHDRPHTDLPKEKKKDAT